MRAVIGFIRSVSLVVLLVGLAFKVLHWPGGEIIISSSLVVFVAASVARFLVRR